MKNTWDDILWVEGGFGAIQIQEEWLIRVDGKLALKVDELEALLLASGLEKIAERIMDPKSTPTAPATHVPEEIA